MWHSSQMVRVTCPALVICVVGACGNQPAPVVRVSIAPASSSTVHANQANQEGVAETTEDDEDDESKPCCAVCIQCRFRRAEKDNTRNALKALHAVVEAWRANHGNECPTPQRLKDEKELDEASDCNDAWGSPYKVIRDDDSTTVYSFGPDRKEGTRDDMRFPNAPDSTP